MTTATFDPLERSAEFDALVADAHTYLKAKQATLESEFRLTHWPRYCWSQETAQLVFSEAGSPRVVADIQFVGSISTISNTWLWSWANDSVDPKLFSNLSVVRDYGESHNFDHLTARKWHAHEVDGWEMTSIAAYLLGAVGAYRTPDDNGFTFMVMTGVAWAS